MIITSELISVIVPVYNVETTLELCVESIRNQTYTNLEIILVDDGSTDNSGRICDNFALLDKRIKVIHKSNNTGLSCARNSGLAVASGMYIGFVDSDDWISCDMYEILYEAIIKYNCDISCIGILKKKNRINKQKPFLSDKLKTVVYSKNEFALRYFKVGYNKTVHYVVNKLYKRKVGIKMHFPEGLINEDVEGFFTALTKTEHICVVNRDAYFYWQNPNGISGSLFSAKQMDLLTVWKNVWNSCCRLPDVEWQYYAKLNYYRASFGLLCRLLLSGKGKQFSNERQILLKNLKYYYRQLMKWNMPLGRKLVMTCMRINYSVMEKIRNFIKL